LRFELCLSPDWARALFIGFVVAMIGILLARYGG
jgi:hypothetical protein